MRASTSEEFRALISAAIIEARRWDLPRVVVGSVDPALLGGSGLFNEEREHMALPLGVFLTREEGEQVEWIANEDFSQCGHR